MRLMYNTLSRILAPSFFVFALCLSGWLGCGTTTGGEASTAKVPTVEDTGEDVNPKGKKWGGWRWQGDRDNCIYVFKNTCFATQKLACKEADCGDGTCTVEAGAPSRVSCEN